MMQVVLNRLAAVVFLFIRLSTFGFYLWRSDKGVHNTLFVVLVYFILHGDSSRSLAFWSYIPNGCFGDERRELKKMLDYKRVGAL
ncbi:unnamed protein product [Linum tenue]|uniref:Uncharacterized protein n=1 Tax=Linum tenue TaxID=586396 RepID=A0AAV0NYV9_9ROSI|nr:unnamed protein product [Linum tenue]